ncbi:hypothetical protein ACFL6C_08510 [Myxococcota bacterium]
MMRRLSIVVFAVGCLRCDGSDPAGCPAGQVMNDGACATICSATHQCDAGLCCDGGVCAPCSFGPPEVLAVNGTGSYDSDRAHTENRLHDRLVIEGENLALATATLTGPSPSVQSYPLPPCAAASENELVVALPASLAQGTFVLTVTNQAGQCDADLRILQGEPGSLEASGYQIVESINETLTNNASLSILRAGDVVCANPAGCVGSAELDVTVAGSLVPSGMIAFFAGDCPSGWTEYESAQGRVPVGLVTDGTIGFQQGTALVDQGLRQITNVPEHDHTIDPPPTTTDDQGAHRHALHKSDCTAGPGAWASLLPNCNNEPNSAWREDNVADAGSHSHSLDVVSFASQTAGSSSVDVTMPYVQLRVCEKD